MAIYRCTAIFDRLPFIIDQKRPDHCPDFGFYDFECAKTFLTSYRNNAATFNAYRREIERLLQWAWHVHKTSVLTLKGKDIETYLKFCQNPPLSWVGVTKVSRFLTKENQRYANNSWRPFIATVSKSAYRQGYQPNPAHYLLSRKSLREIFTILNSFYQFMIQENMTLINPTKQIRQKSHFFESHQYEAKIRRLSDIEWDYVVETAEIMAEDSIEHERTLFIISALYSLYLRISELSTSHRWMPTMNHFHQDENGLWWFTTVGKGNKRREITVSDDLLASLKRYRLSLGLTALPSPSESHPLILKQRGKGPIRSTSQIRIIVQRCFDQTIQRLKKDGLATEADRLQEATVHWLRHTGISDDVKHRPREHVRDDAGHSSKIIDTYLDITRTERHASGKMKRIRPDI